jgi:hypothetical protein
MKLRMELRKRKAVDIKGSINPINFQWTSNWRREVGGQGVE